MKVLGTVGFGSPVFGVFANDNKSRASATASRGPNASSTESAWARKPDTCR